MGLMRKHVKHDLLTPPQLNPENTGPGFIQTWSVLSGPCGYVVTDGFLQAPKDPTSARWYNPFAEYELPTQLARIATGELSLEEFAGRFGLLGYENLFRQTMLARAMPGRELLRQLSRDKAIRKGGEPVKWVLAHSRTVALCLQLIGVLEEADSQAIVEAVETTTPGPYAWGLGVGKLSTAFARQTLEVRPKLHAGIARGWLRNFITENIAGISRRMDMDAYGTRLASFFSFRAMIQTVYWQLADKVEGGGIRRCLECKRFFLARDKRQQYCPPFPGATRSRCSSRLNTSSFRELQQGRREGAKHAKRQR